MKRLLPVILFLCLLSPALVHSQQSAPVPVLVPEVLNTYPHDPEAYTQGLLVFNGLLYESTGLRGESSLRQVDPTTGEVLKLIPVSRTADGTAGTPAASEYFAEGLERVDESLIQLTWQENVAFVYDINTFAKTGEFAYEGEGWGLCYDGRYLFMSDSTNYLSLRDATTFDLIVRFLVTYQGGALQPQLLNELECVGDYIYANLWQTDFIVQIDKFTGQVTALIDASNLLTDDEKAALGSSQVLNGIAYNPETDTFYITGKQWSKLFEVKFVPAPPETPDE
jgi:glutaminyl-peptide cyclotransferase